MVLDQLLATVPAEDAPVPGAVGPRFLSSPGVLRVALGIAENIATGFSGTFGGTIVQLLLDRGLGAAGAALSSGPVMGVRRLPLSTIRATLPVLRNPANRRKAVPLTPAQFHYAFANTLTPAESRDAYDRYHVPAAGGVFFEGALANVNPKAPTKVDLVNRNRAPLPFIASGMDHVIPPTVNRENARKDRKSSALTAYHEFPGRSHFVVGQPGWEEVADHALSWALNPTVVGAHRA